MQISGHKSDAQIFNFKNDLFDNVYIVHFDKNVNKKIKNSPETQGEYKWKIIQTDILYSALGLPPEMANASMPRTTARKRSESGYPQKKDVRTKIQMGWSKDQPIFILLIKKLTNSLTHDFFTITGGCTMPKKTKEKIMTKKEQEETTEYMLTHYYSRKLSEAKILSAKKSKTHKNK